MPKSRPPSRSKQPAADLPETPPVQADVERAIATILDRLKPKPAPTPRRKSAPATPKPPCKARAEHLALVPGSDD